MRLIRITFATNKAGGQMIAACLKSVTNANTAEDGAAAEVPGFFIRVPRLRSLAEIQSVSQVLVCDGR